MYRQGQDQESMSEITSLPFDVHNETAEQCCLLLSAQIMAVQSADTAREYLKDAPNVTVVELPINDGWTRDWGPSVSHQAPIHSQACDTKSLLAPSQTLTPKR